MNVSATCSIPDVVELLLLRRQDRLPSTPSRVRIEGPKRTAEERQRRAPYVRTYDHVIEIVLHPDGIGGSPDPVGAADCLCQYDHDWAWQTGRTPRLLPYGELATWLAQHLVWAGAEAERVAPLLSVPTLLALAR